MRGGVLDLTCEQYATGDWDNWFDAFQYGDYVQVQGGHDSYHFKLVAKRTNGTFEPITDGFREIYAGHFSECLYLKSDGRVYFRSADGADVLLLDESNFDFEKKYVAAGEIYANGVWFTIEDWDEPYEQHEMCFDKTGTAMDPEKLVAYEEESSSQQGYLLLADGTKVSRISGKDQSGNAVVRNGYTICNGGSNIKHGNSDVWWAKDASGKWGAIDSYGNVKVPFVYDAYFDGGATDTDYALVKQNGEWRFLNVLTSGLDVSPAKDTSSALDSGLANKTDAESTAKSTKNTSSDSNSGLANKTDAKTTTKSAKDISSASVSRLASKTYTGSALKPVPTISLGGTKLKNGIDYKLKYANNVNAGTASVTATGIGAYVGKVSATFTIGKAANPMKVKANAKTKVLKARALAKKGKSFAVVKFTKAAVGKVVFKSASSKKVAKKFSVNKKTGKVTAKKGTKAGTYKVKIKITAKGDKNRKAATKTVGITVKVR